MSSPFLSTPPWNRSLVIRIFPQSCRQSQRVCWKNSPQREIRIAVAAGGPEFAILYHYRKTAVFFVQDVFSIAGKLMRSSANRATCLLITSLCLQHGNASQPFFINAKLYCNKVLFSWTHCVFWRLVTKTCCTIELLRYTELVRFNFDSILSFEDRYLNLWKPITTTVQYRALQKNQNCGRYPNLGNTNIPNLIFFTKYEWTNMGLWTTPLHRPWF